MILRYATGVFVCLLTLVTLAGRASSLFAADATVKVAFWNVMSGTGVDAFADHPTPFVNTSNCTDPTQPLNGWGMGAMQAVLTQTLSDPSVIALGLADAWGCASPEHVRQALGWKAATAEQNGVAMVARFGFAGPAQWQQLDTTLNTMPADTMWIVRAPVCLDTACTKSMLVYSAHWNGTGANSETSFTHQAQETLSFLNTTSGGEPHVFVGDLNVFEGPAKVCDQSPNNTALPILRSGGYSDAWVTIHGAAEGYTGMANRTGCGYPLGYAFKRIDYAWSPASYQAIDIQRFGMMPPGDASPSNHYGILVTLPYPGAPAPTPVPTPTPAPAPVPTPAPVPANSGDIVLYAKNARTITGAWALVDDATAAGGVRIANPDAGVPKLTVAAAAPASYFELPFTAESGRPYRLWIRGKAQNDSWQNDSTFVQFSGAVDAGGAPAFRIGTTTATVVSIEEASGMGVSGWGWQDNGYGAGVLGPAIYFDGTPQTLRVQVREDGLSIDQIVLCPVQYATVAPGAGKNDTTILAAPVVDLTEIVLHTSAATALVGTWHTIADATAADGTAIGNNDSGAAKVASAAAAPANYVDLAFDAQAGTAYRLWMRVRADADYWGNDSVFVQFSNAVDAGGAPVYRIGTTSSTTVNLEDGSGAGVAGWGWQDNGYGANIFGPVIYFDTTGRQTVRVQVREDGFRFDQLVLSARKFLTSAPGPLKNDATILPTSAVQILEQIGGAGPTISTAADLTAALKVGGTARLAPGIYQGNFIITKPTVLSGGADAVLVPLDMLAPTLSIQASDVTVTGLTVRNGAPDRECVVVGNIAATEAATQPNRVTLDGIRVEAGATGGHRGIALHGMNLTVKNSRVTGFWEAGRDAQAVWINNGPGPYTVENNYLEGSGENILVGGDSIKIPNVVPSDIVIRGNVVAKPDSWRTNGATVKNSIEVKIGRRVLIEGNTIDGNWRNGQDGSPILLTTRNQNGDNPWAVIDDVVVRANTTQRCADGFAVSILGADDAFASQQMQTVTIEGNLFRESPNGFRIGNGVATALTIRHNTLPAVQSNFLQFYDTRPTLMVSPFTFVANVVLQGEYGVSGTNLGSGLPTLTAYTKLLAFTDNIIEKNPARTNLLPPGNTWVEPGALATLLDPKTLKLLAGTAGY